MGPTQRHCRASCGAAFHPTVAQIITIPKLFADHPTLVGKVFHRLDERLRIASGSQFVMAAFSSQNRPAATHARPVESATVVFLPVTIMIVTTPARALRQIGRASCRETA